VIGSRNPKAAGIDGSPASLAERPKNVDAAHEAERASRSCNRKQAHMTAQVAFARRRRVLIVNGFADGRDIYVDFLRYHELEVRCAASLLRPCASSAAFDRTSS
jgi:hypothetical protein